MNHEQPKTNIALVTAAERDLQYKAIGKLAYAYRAAQLQLTRWCYAQTELTITLQDSPYYEAMAEAQRQYSEALELALPSVPKPEGLVDRIEAIARKAGAKPKPDSAPVRPTKLRVRSKPGKKVPLHRRNDPKGKGGR